MNKLELRRVQEENMLTDILVSLQDTREDFSFTKNRFPVTLEMFTFSKYTLQDLLLINESFKIEVFYINFLDWFLRGELDDSRLESYHNSQKDVVIGYLSLNTIKDCISKIQNRLLKLEGQDNVTNINNITFYLDENTKKPIKFSVNGSVVFPLRGLSVLLKFFNLHDMRLKHFNTKDEMYNYLKPLNSKSGWLYKNNYINSRALFIEEKVQNGYEIRLKNPKIIRLSKNYS